MAQHPMVKAYIREFAKNGGKQWKGRFNPHSLDQTFLFGYRRFVFRIKSAGTVADYDSNLIPPGVTSREDVVMIPDVCNALGGWLSCDTEAKAEFEAFAKVVAVTFAK